MQVHSPIVALDGDMALALYGSALPLPDLASFGVPHGWTKHTHTRRVPPPPLTHPTHPSTKAKSLAHSKASLTNV